MLQGTTQAVDVACAVEHIISGADLRFGPF